MRVFSTGRFGLRRRTGSTFSKNVKIGRSVDKRSSPNHENGDDLGSGGSPRAHIR